MATEVQKGLATVYGVVGATIDGYAAVKTQGARATQNFDMSEVKDENGFDANLTATNEHSEIEVDFIPTATTRALAAAKFIFVAPLAKVTLSGFTVAAYNGDWINMSGASMNLANNAGGAMTLRLRKYADATQNAAMAAAAISG
jgi:hypothetical protein